jgi:hypothetical protein
VQKMVQSHYICLLQGAPLLALLRSLPALLLVVIFITSPLLCSFHCHRTTRVAWGGDSHVLAFLCGEHHAPNQFTRHASPLQPPSIYPLILVDGLILPLRTVCRVMWHSTALVVLLQLAWNPPVPPPRA